MLRINLVRRMKFADLTFAKDGKQFSANRHVIPSPRCLRAPSSRICARVTPNVGFWSLSAAPTVCLRVRYRGSFCRACPWRSLRHERHVSVRAQADTSWAPSRSVDLTLSRSVPIAAMAISATPTSSPAWIFDIWERLLSPNPAASCSNTKPHAGQADCNDSCNNYAARDTWEPIAVHVATRSGIMRCCKPSGEATVCGGRYLPVRSTDRHATWPASDYAADGLRNG